MFKSNKHNIFPFSTKVHVLSQEDGGKSNVIGSESCITQHNQQKIIDVDEDSMSAMSMHGSCFLKPKKKVYVYIHSRIALSVM